LTDLDEDVAVGFFTEEIYRKIPHAISFTCCSDEGFKKNYFRFFVAFFFAVFFAAFFFAAMSKFTSS
jgi:hypothetical protein